MSFCASRVLRGFLGAGVLVLYDRRRLLAQCSQPSAGNRNGARLAEKVWPRSNNAPLAPHQPLRKLRRSLSRRALVRTGPASAAFRHAVRAARATCWKRSPADVTLRESFNVEPIKGVEVAALS